MSRLDDLTHLYLSLDELLKRAATKESDFQSWFERNLGAFEILGFKRAIPKPRLYLATGTYYEPDFLVQDYNGVWCIFELKRPDTAVLKNPTRRTDLAAEFSAYVQQCREYADFFLDAANRIQIQQEYAIEVQRSVPGFVVASTDEHTDRSTVRELLVDRGNKVTLQTYSEVLDAIHREIDRQAKDAASLSGLFVSILAWFPRKPLVRDQVLVDFGSTENRDRLTIRLRDGTFVIHLLDNDCESHVVEVRRPIVVDFANTHELTLLEVEFGVASDELYIGAFLNRRCMARKFSQAVRVLDEPLHNVVFGSDLFGKTQADFAIIEMIVYEHTLSWGERACIYQHLDEVYSYYFSPLAIYSPMHILFRGHKFLSTEGHPTCPGSSERRVPKESSRKGGPWGWWVASKREPPNSPSRKKWDRHLGPETVPLPGMEPTKE